MYNFKYICRTCSCEGNLQPLFDENPIIADMLTEVVDLKILKDDNFPQNICNYCYEKLEGAYNFKKQCHNIHKKFEEYLQSRSHDQSWVPEDFIKHEDLETVSSTKEENAFHIHLDESDVLQEGSEFNLIENVQTNSNPQKNYKKEIKKCKFECNICYKKVNNIKEHRRSHTKEKPYKCEICSIEFSIRSNYTRHLKIHKNNRAHVCNICGQGFFEKYALRAHMPKHLTETPFKCELCEKSYKRQSHLKFHVSSKHSNEKPRKLGMKREIDIDGGKLYLCNHCGKIFVQKINLNQHIRSHTGERPYKCTICNKSFAYASIYSTHKKIHTGERPYKCEYCDASFIHKVALTDHEAIHTGLKPYTCKICDKTFRQSSHLNRHKRTHTGEKPFKCSVCDRQFAESGNLTVHMRIHTGEKPYVCSICNKGFYNSSGMKRHKKKHLSDIKINKI